jgi:hypothetical protein
MLGGVSAAVLAFFGLAGVSGVLLVSGTGKAAHGEARGGTIVSRSMVRYGRLFGGSIWTAFDGYGVLWYAISKLVRYLIIV